MNAQPQSTDLQLSAVPLEFWVGAAAILFLTAALGFFAGVCYVRMSVENEFERASRHMARLYQLVAESLDRAQRACSILERSSGFVLTPAQTEQLEKRQTRLLDTISRIVECQRSAVEAVAQVSIPHSPRTQPATIEWQKPSEDARTGLPDRTSFEANLDALLEVGRETARESGLLFVRIDKLQQLADRFGSEAAEHFLETTGRILCRSIRDEDLVCRHRSDTFAILIPFIDRESGRRIAESIRDTIRHFHYRLNNCGTEVLVTCSLGYTVCTPGDNSDLVVGRCSDALAESQRRGRNQLHLYEGAKLHHCLAG